MEARVKPPDWSDRHRVCAFLGKQQHFRGSCAQKRGLKAGDMEGLFPWTKCDDCGRWASCLLLERES